MRPHLPLGLRSVLLPAVAALAVYAPSAFGAVDNTASGTYGTAIVNPFDSTLEYAQWVRNAGATGGYELDSSTSVHWINSSLGNAVIQLTGNNLNVGTPMNLSGINIALETTNADGAANNSGQMIVNGAINAESVWFKGGRYRVDSSATLANAGHLYVQGGHLWINANNQTIANAVTLGASDFVDTYNTISGTAFSGASLRLNNTTTTFSSAVTVAENTKIGYAAGASLSFSDLTLATGATVTFGKYSTGNDLALTLTGTLRLTGDGGLETGISSSGLGVVTLSSNLTFDLTSYAGAVEDGQALTNFTLGNVTSGVQYTVTGTALEGYIMLNNGVATFYTATQGADLTWNTGSGVWDTTTANWQGDGGIATTFSNKDVATFSGVTGTITVDEALVSGKTNVQGNSTITLDGSGSVTGPMQIESGSRVTLDGDTTFTLTGAITLDAGSKLTLTGTGNVTAATSMLGEGTVEVIWGASSGMISADLTGWSGTLEITSGRYDAVNSAAALNIAQATEIVVKDGGQFYVAGSVTSASNFTLSGNGWTNTDDPARQGALRIENGASISGTITLAGDTGVQVYSGTGTLNGAITGNGNTLTKYGAGTLVINNTTSNLNLTIERGIVQFQQDRTYILNTVTVKSGATLQDRWNTRLNITELNMEGGSILDLYDGGALYNPVLTFGTMNVSGEVQVRNHTNGNLFIAGTIVGAAEGTNTLKFTTGRSTSHLTVQSAISGNLNIEKNVNSTLTLSGENTYEGNTTVSAGTLNVSGSIEGTNNTYTANGGTIGVTSTAGFISNSAVKIAKNGTTNASIQNATVGTSSIEVAGTASEKGTVQNAVVTIEADTYSINSVTLANSLVDLQSTGSVTLDNVTIGAGTSVSNTGGGIVNLVNTTVDLQSAAGNVTLDGVTIGAGTTVANAGSGTVTLNNSKLVMTTTQTTIGTLNNETHTLSVTSTGLAGYTTISGSLTFDLTKEWVDNLVSSVDGNFTTIELTFSDVNEDVWNDFKANGSSSLAQTGELNDSMFGPPSVTFGSTAGTVIIAATTNIPEPATATLGLLGLSSLLLRRRRKA